MSALSQMRRSRLALLGVGLFTLALLLAWASSRFQSLAGSGSFFILLTLATALLYLGWRALAQESPPRWLGYLLLASALLRLALGVLWWLALPVWGYPENEVQRAGYVMEDAYNRDGIAWRLARSESPLWLAFSDFSATDQYGGLLFLSAFLYRHFAAASHQPLLLIVLAAAGSALAVPFTWAFAKRAWGTGVASLAAVGLALYPEALLLGSSQMREAFTVTLSMMALYALLRFQRSGTWENLAWMAVPLLLALPLSPPFAVLLLTALLLGYAGLREWQFLRSRAAWFGGIGLLALGALAFWFFLGFDFFRAAQWQAYVSLNASGWVARMFERIPAWSHVPFLVFYGVFRPLLPAALIADGLPLWRVVGIWRSLGWTIVLVMLLYASFLALRGWGRRKLLGALLIVVWVAILVASFRGGGDLWDSPRYRAAFAGVQVSLAAWAWVKHRELADPWLRRAFGAAVMMFFWFIPWYLRRYTPLAWPVVELSHTVGLGLATAVLYWIWDWVGAHSKLEGA